MGSMPQLAVVLPAHNAGVALTDTVVATARVVADLVGDDGAVVVVDDGSTDGSFERLEAAIAADPVPFASVTVVAHAERRGKGAALRTGFATTPAAWMAFCDGDGDIPPTYLADLAARVGLGGVPGSDDQPPDAVCGVKNAGAHLPLLRRVASELFKLFRRLVLPLGITDSQTGLKLFSGPALVPVLPSLREDGFAFDLEALAALRATGHGRFATVTVVPQRVSTSSVSARSVVQLAWATLRLGARYRLGRGPGRPSAHG
jgi:glycosyltransferase involved in cell wall biosynthesis